MPKKTREPVAMFVATEDLYASGPGTMPGLVQRAGERLSAKVLERHPEWQDKVRPEGAPAEPPADEPPPARQRPRDPQQSHTRPATEPPAS